MSDQDQVRPYHAREVGSGKETADTLAEVLKHAAEREEASRERRNPRGQPRWMLPLGINLGVLAVYLLIAPPAWVVINPIEAPPSAAQVEGLRKSLYFLASRVESYRQANGRLPERLEDAGSAPAGVDYIVRGVSSYQLVGSVGDETVVYDASQSSLDEFGRSLDFTSGGRGG